MTCYENDLNTSRLAQGFILEHIQVDYIWFMEVIDSAPSRIIVELVDLLNSNRICFIVSGLDSWGKKTVGIEVGHGCVV